MTKLLAVVALLVSHAVWADAPDPQQTNIQRDLRGRIERRYAAKAAFKRLHPCPVTQKATGPCPGYVIDHVVALKRGGADAPENMQWQTVEEARAKDRWE